MDWYAIHELLTLVVRQAIPFLLGILFAKYWWNTSKRGSTKMPSAVVVNGISDKVLLKTLPPDGFVVVRRMTYGEELARSGKATKLLVGGDGKNKADFQGEVDIQTEALALWDFANLVVEHNCEDIDGRTLNFKNVNDVKKLDSRIGKEIGEIIDAFNTVEETEEVKNS
jgi:hypothetical protein